MKELSLVALLVFFSCSQEKESIIGPDQNSLALASYTVTGVVIDYEDYLKEVTVCLDQSKNLQCDPDEAKAISSSDGAFSLDVGRVSELNLLAEVKGQNSYYLASKLEECNYSENQDTGLFCELNITPFTNYLALSAVGDSSKSYADLRSAALTLFSKHIEGFKDIDFNYIKSSEGLGLIEFDSGSFEVFKVLARILVNVAVNSNINTIASDSGNNKEAITPEVLQKEVSQVMETVEMIFQEIDDQNIQITDVGSDFQVMERIITKVRDIREQLRDRFNDLPVETFAREEEEPEIDFVAEALTDALPESEPEPILASEPEQTLDEVAIAALPDLPRPEIRLFENDQQTNLFILKNTPVKVEITSYVDKFIKFQNDNSSLAASLGLSDLLSIKIYEDAVCSTLVPSTPVDGSPGVLELDFSQLASKTTQVYSQIEFADKKSSCSPMLPKIVAYSLDNLNFICNNSTSFIGSGASAADPKIICNTNDFKNIRILPDKHFLLASDIDLSTPQEEDVDNYDDDGWIPLPSFSGSLDGNNYKITGLSINRPSEDEQGLFAKISSGASISNLVLGESQVDQKTCNPDSSDSNNSYSGCDIVFASEGGALAGMLNIGDEDINISNIVNNYSIYATSNYGGGIIGRISYIAQDETGGLILTNLRNQQAVSGDSSYVGGVLGYVSTSSGNLITGTKLVNTGDVWSVTGNVGGVGGGINGYGYVDIKELENSGTIDSEGDYTGGVFGRIDGVTIEKIKNTGKVISTSDRVGGVTGNAISSTINYSWNTAEITAQDRVGGIIGNGNTLVVNDARNSGIVITHVNNGYDVGGIVGSTQSSTYQKLFNSGTVTGKTRVAGIIGSASNETLSYVINHGYVTGTNALGGIMAGISSGDLIMISVHNAGTVAAKSWKLGGILGYYYGYNEIRKIIDGLNSAGLQGSYNVGGSTYMGAIIGAVSENGVADPGIDLFMLSMERVLNLNSAYHDTSPPENFGIMFGVANYWSGAVLKKDIWAGASQFSASELPSPAPKMSAYGVKANLAPITDTNDSNNFGTNTLMLCIDADDSDSDGDVCTHANPISAADFYSDSTIGLDSSSNWKLGPAVFSESIALGDGSTESFTAILQLDSISAADTVKIQFIHNGAVRTAIDDGLGNFSATDNGTWLGTSTIDYNTGEVNLQFNSGEAPEDNEAISIQYTSVTSVPILNFTWDWEDNPNTFPWSGTLIP